ncbi:MAG: MBL fold metallo-hydrolase [Candidatus Eremiobacteraeota bacterium]|nr:MBL fold metallo-hydrolase [Candidatus Eremiobacteraeota bacterium]
MPRPGEASSCYLIRAGETALLFDLGSGAFAKLQLAIDYRRVDAIVISHMHADHFFDVVPFRYALKYGHLPFEQRLALWLPPGGKRSLGALRRAVSTDAPEDFFDSLFVVREYDPGETLTVRGVSIRFRQTRHYVDAYAIRAQSGERSITYSADTAPCDAVVELARATSLFLCETALGVGVEDANDRGHSSAKEAGTMAQRAQAERLLLTHYPAAVAPQSLVHAAKQHFSGRVDAAHDGFSAVV